MKRRFSPFKGGVRANLGKIASVLAVITRESLTEQLKSYCGSRRYPASLEGCQGRRTRKPVLMLWPLEASMQWRKASLLRSTILVGAILGIQSFCWAQDKPSPIDWQDGPTIGKLGDIAQISVPQGYRFTGKAGAQKLLELTQNPADGNELGALIPKVNQDADIWFSIFEFQDTGYVRDDEKDNLDSAAMLDSIKKATEASNKIREQRGWPPFHVVGWSHTPY